MVLYQVHPYIMLKELITFSVENKIETLRFISDIKKIFFFFLFFLPLFCLKNNFIFILATSSFLCVCMRNEILLLSEWLSFFFFAKFKNTFQFRMSEREWELKH